MYTLFIHIFQIMSLITKGLCIVQIIAILDFVKCVVKAKIDFHNKWLNDNLIKLCRDAWLYELNESLSIHVSHHSLSCRNTTQILGAQLYPSGSSNVLIWNISSHDCLQF